MLLARFIARHWESRWLIPPSRSIAAIAIVLLYGKLRGRAMMLVAHQECGRYLNEEAHGD